MKGKLNKTERGWVVIMCVGDGVAEVWEETLPLHPKSIELTETRFTSKFTQEVEFEIVKEYINSYSNQVQKYAKLINHIGESNKMV